ncbi:MAG: cell division topological specificity factor MinE [Desulfobacterales bacterium]|nr:cell division topological specificity factor MinE [Desulfobacterales bacterium]
MLNGLFDRFGGSRKPAPKEEAKRRLQFALVYDQLEVSDTTLSDLQRDIVDVISKYFEIDQEGLDLKVERDAAVSALVFNTPILQVRRRQG